MINPNLKVSTGEEYFAQVDKEIDWEETGDETKVPLQVENDIEEILATEISIYLLRRTYAGIGNNIDTMVGLRRKLINEYESKYEPYVEYNEYY